MAAKSTGAAPRGDEQPRRNLKELIDEALVQRIADAIARAEPTFDAAGFTRTALDGLRDKELTPRAWQIAEALHAFLPRPFGSAAQTLVDSLGPELHESGEEMGRSPLGYLPHVFFVQQYGLADFEAAMHAQYELTKRFSAEFSIRAFLVHHPEATYGRLERWASDPNVHVRRLVSEGTRPRLPWAPRLRAFQEDPRPVLALLERLKDDPARYVQRSVANNLNDIAKDHPALVLEICRRWSENAAEGRRWIVRHALRSLVKSGHPEALALLGVGHEPAVGIHTIACPVAVQLGSELRFSCALESTAGTTQQLVVDYAVHFVKANGTTRPKVFKLRRLTLAPAATAQLEAKISFAPMTTRRHYPGAHRIELRINGTAHELGSFELLA